MGGVHLGALRVDVHVDLAAHAEAVRQIDPRLDRETHARYERARVFRFEVVDVRPGAVQIAIDRMARAMHEVVGEPGVADHGACDVIQDRKSTRLNSSHGYISYAVFCLKKKKKMEKQCRKYAHRQWNE